MINNDKIIQELIHGDSVTKISENKNVTQEDARKVLAEMSFKDYIALDEATITPPSGATIGPSANGNQEAPASGPSKVKSIWPGQGAPVEVGMTVGLKGPNGTPAPGEISKVDQAGNGVMVKNPTTGQAEWMNIDNLEPFMVDTDEQPQESTISRLRELAGISENCSAGATGAGAIAVAPTAMSAIKKRQSTDEESDGKLKKEYKRKEPPKTVAGDTKPKQASGELSATLAANNKKSATRTKNGLRR